MSIEGTAKTEYASLSGKIHTFVVDKTLSISGACADAKVVGDNIERLDESVSEALEAYEESKGIYDETVLQMETVAREVADEVAKAESRDAVDKLTARDVEAYSIPEVDAMIYPFQEYQKHWWRRRANTVTGQYVLTYGTRQEYKLLDQRNGETTVNIYPVANGNNVSINQSTGELTYNRVNLVSVTGYDSPVSNGTGIADRLNQYSNYYINDPNDRTKLLFVNTPNSYSTGGYGGSNYQTYIYAQEMSAEYRSSGSVGEWEYLTSVDQNTYPQSGIKDGIEYEYLGIPFDNAVHVSVKIMNALLGVTE